MPAISKILRCAVSYLATAGPPASPVPSNNGVDVGPSAMDMAGTSRPNPVVGELNSGVIDVVGAAMEDEPGKEGGFAIESSRKPSPFHAIAGATDVDYEQFPKDMMFAQTPFTTSEEHISYSVPINKRSIDAVSKTCGTVDVVAVGKDSLVYHTYWNRRSGIHAFTNVGVRTSTPPTIISDQEGDLDVFALGQNKAVYVRHQDHHDNWSELIQLGGEFVSNLRAAAAGPNNTVTCALGGDNGQIVFCKHRINGVWAEQWVNLGGYLISETAIVSTRPDEFDIYALGLNNKIFFKGYRKGQWSDSWKPMLGGPFDSPVTAVSWGPGRFDYFAVDQKGVPQHKYWDPVTKSWGGFNSLDGVLSTVITAATSSWFGAKRIDIAAIGSTTYLFLKSFDGSKQIWGSWVNHGGDFDSAPVITNAGGDALHLFVVGIDGKLKHQYYNGNDWSPAEKEWYNYGGTFLRFKS